MSETDGTLAATSPSFPDDAAQSMRLAERWRAGPPTWRAVWGPRPEEPEVVASKMRQTLSALHRLGGVFDAPWSSLDGGAVPDDDRGWTDLVAAAIEHDDRDTPLPVRGHRLAFVTPGIDSVGDAFARLSFVTSSAVASSKRPSNSVTLRVEGRDDSHLVHLPLAGSATEITRLLAAIWDPDAVELLDRAIVDTHFDVLQRPGSWPRVGPVTFLSARSHPRAREVGLSVATTQSTTGGTLILVGGGTSPDAYLEACLTTSRELADSGVLGPVPSAHDSEPHGMPAVDGGRAHESKGEPES